MKLILTSILIFLTILACEKKTTVIESNEITFNSNYFPLKIGYVWFERFFPNSFKSEDAGDIYFRKEIVSTTEFDGEEFYVFEVKRSFENGVQYEYYNINDKGIVQFRKESITHIVGDLSTPPGEYYNNEGEPFSVITISEAEESVLGQITKVRHYSKYDGEVNKTASFAEGIGMISHGAISYSILLAAKIDNISYGDSTIYYYNKHFDYYPLEVGNKWLYEYIKYSDSLNIIRSTFLNREVVKDSLFSNGYRFFKIVSQFEDSTQIFIDWQRLDLNVAKLYGYDIVMDKEYLIDDYTISDEELHFCDSYMYSIFPYLIDGYVPQYPSENIKTYYGGNFDNETFYEFTKGIGLSKIILTWYPLNPQITEELNLVSSEIQN